MWLTTDAGHYQIEQDPRDARRLLVQTRDHESAQVARDTLETLYGAQTDVETIEGADYPYRFRAERERVAQWLAAEVRDYVIYGDFQRSVRESRGDVWANTLEKVSSDMMDISD